MRAYIPDYSKWGLSKRRCRELWAFCSQYPEWKSEAASLIGVGAQQYSTMPHGSDPGDPVARLVEKREALLKKIDLVESVARAVDGGRWFAVLIQNCCLGKPLEYIDQALMPTSNRNEYYQRRRAFYLLLDEARDGLRASI